MDKKLYNLSLLPDILQAFFLILIKISCKDVTVGP